MALKDSSRRRMVNLLLSYGATAMQSRAGHFRRKDDDYILESSERNYVNTMQTLELASNTHIAKQKTIKHISDNVRNRSPIEFDSLEKTEDNPKTILFALRNHKPKPSKSDYDTNSDPDNELEYIFKMDDEDEYYDNYMSTLNLPKSPDFTRENSMSTGTSVPISPSPLYGFEPVKLTSTKATGSNITKVKFVISNV